MLNNLLAKIFSVVVDLRNVLYDRKIFGSYKSALPVICVGNIALGGSGKTPTTIYLAKTLQARGWRPVILSRGYKGKAQGPLLVHKDSDFQLCGDEPLLIAIKTGLPVVVSKDRSAGARLIEKQNLGDIILLDDGMQHRRLERELNILCVDVSSKDSILNVLSEKLVPASRLREKLSSALRRTDIVLLVNRSGEAQNLCDLKQALAGKPLIHADYKVMAAQNSAGAELDRSSSLTAFCGLANPEPFFNTLKSNGYNINKTFSFIDHYKFTPEDIKQIKLSAPDNKLICTEKDYVKLQLPELYYLPIELKVDPDFIEFVLNSLQE